MRRSTALSIFAVGILVGLGGIFAFLNRAPQHSGSAPISAASIYAEAEARIAKPVLPDRPAGATELPPKATELHFSMAHRDVKDVPAITHYVPQIADKTEADTKWQNEVNARQAAYERQLQDEIDRLSSEQAKQEAQPDRSGSSLMTGIVIPLIVAVGGLITALASLIQALRAPKDRPAA